MLPKRISFSHIFSAFSAWLDALKCACWISLLVILSSRQIGYIFSCCIVLYVISPYELVTAFHHTLPKWRSITTRNKCFYEGKYVTYMWHNHTSGNGCSASKDGNRMHVYVLQRKLKLCVCARWFWDELEKEQKKITLLQYTFLFTNITEKRIFFNLCDLSQSFHQFLSLYDLRGILRLSS